MLADDIAACAEVARTIRIPVATGENNYSRFEFRDLLERRAARYLMPDVCRANGFSETLRIGHLAAAHRSPSRPTWSTSCRCTWPAPWQRLPRGVHGLGAGRPLRGDAPLRGRRLPHPRPPRPRHGAGAGRGGEVPVEIGNAGLAVQAHPRVRSERRGTPLGAGGASRSHPPDPNGGASHEASEPDCPGGAGVPDLRGPGPARSRRGPRRSRS